MSVDEYGMPLPNKATQLPWDSSIRLSGRGIEWVTSHDAFNHKSNRDFVLHAANNIIECREIVRRLATWSQGDSMDDFLPTIRDAEKLWDKMQREAKGDGER